MTRMSAARFGAGLLAIACLAVGMAVSGSASASPSAKVAKKPGKRPCPPRAICLWSEHFGGKQLNYGCGDKPRGESYLISFRPQDFPLDRRGGVSSYRNNGIQEAALHTVGQVSGRSIPLPRNSSGTSRNNRLLDRYDDKASALFVTC